jgi:phosphate uptake regulator
MDERGEPVEMSDIEEKEEARKVQFSGKSSFVLALPKKWVQEMNMRAGDQVIVKRQGDTSLLVTPKSARLAGSKTEVLIEVASEEKPHSIARRLISVYLLGYNAIRVNGKDGALTTAQRAAVQETMRRHLIGTETIADSVHGVTLQVLLSYPELDVKTVVKRMFLIATSMHRDAMNSLKNLDKDAAAGIIRTDDEVDRFNLYAIRQLNIAVQNEFVLKEIGLATRRDCLDYRLIVKSVERVADHATKIAEGIQSLERPLNARLVTKVNEMSDFAGNLFEEAGLALFKGDYQAADKVVDEARRAAEMQKHLLNALDRVKSPGSSHVWPLIIEDVRRTADYSADVAEVVINMVTERAVTKEETLKA